MPRGEAVAVRPSMRLKRLPRRGTYRSLLSFHRKILVVFKIQPSEMELITVLAFAPLALPVSTCKCAQENVDEAANTICYTSVGHH